MCDRANAAGRVAAQRSSSNDLAENEDEENGERIKALTARAKMFRAAANAEKFDLQGNQVGYHWSKEVANKPDLKEDDDRVGKSRDAQRLYRKRWAARHANKLDSQIMMLKKETYTEIDESIGEFVSIATIYRDEGGESSNPVIRRAGIAATANYLEFCMRQAHFVQFNEATGRCDFLKLTRRWRKQWEQSWTLKTVMQKAKEEKQRGLRGRVPRG